MKKHIIVLSTVLILLNIGLSGCIKESIWLEQEKLQVLDTNGEKGFGISVSICGDTAIIGAFLDDSNGLDSGSAYVFRRDGDSWTQEAKLLPSDGVEKEYFGNSVCTSEDTVLIGAMSDNGKGSAYVFRRVGNSWTQEAKLLPSDGAEHDEFGISVSIYGDIAIIGAHKDDSNGLDSGSAYVFRRDGDSWTQEAKLLPSDGAEHDEFGISVSIDEDTALIGTHYDSDNGWDSGSAYVFRGVGNSWTQEAKLLPSDGVEYDEFGISVSIDGNIALIGAFGSDDNGWDSGSAYVFRGVGNSWTQEAKLLPSDGSEDSEFGISVSVDSGTILIGSQNFNDESAFIFKEYKKN